MINKAVSIIWQQVHLELLSLDKLNVFENETVLSELCFLNMNKEIVYEGGERN